MFDRNGVIYARESVLVDAQCLLQRALNETYGNPRDYEEDDPQKTKKLFREQRVKLAKLLGWTLGEVNRYLFNDDSDLSIKDLAEALYVLGYELKLDLQKKST